MEFGVAKGWKALRTLVVTSTQEALPVAQNHSLTKSLEAATMVLTFQVSQRCRHEQRTEWITESSRDGGPKGASDPECRGLRRMTWTEVTRWPTRYAWVWREGMCV